MSFSFGNSSFGTPAAKPAFGANASGTSSFNFGTPATAAQSQSSGFGNTITFGSPAPVAAITPFGTTAQAPSAFGTQSTSAPAQPNFSGRLGPSTSVPATFTGFGNTATTAPAASTAFSFGSTVTTNSINAPTFSFNSTTLAPNPAKTTATLSFGTTTTTVGTSLFGKTTAGLTTAAIAAPPVFVGLGGVDVNTASQPRIGEQAQSNIKVKEMLVPDDIAKTVEDLKAYIKQQKSLSSDIGRASLSKLYGVTNEIQSLNFSIQEVTNLVEQSYNQTKSLRIETSKAIQNAEIAQRTNDTPSGLQFENSAPFLYFVSLVEKYEKDLITYRNQISSIESHMKSIMNPQGINPSELKNGLQHINECFISLAGRLHEIHQKVETQKEQFLNLRKYRLRNNENVFASIDENEKKSNAVKISSGPTPFSNISGITNYGISVGRTGSSTKQ